MSYGPTNPEPMSMAQSILSLFRNRSPRETKAQSAQKAPNSLSGPKEAPTIEIQKPRLFVDHYGTVYTKTDQGSIVRVSAKAKKQPR